MIPSLFIYFFNFQCLEEIVVPNRNFVFLVATSGMTLCDPMDCSLPGSSVHGISHQEYWSGLHCPPPGDLPDPGIEPASPVLQADSLPIEPHGKLQVCD